MKCGRSVSLPASRQPPVLSESQPSVSRPRAGGGQGRDQQVGLVHPPYSWSPCLYQDQFSVASLCFKTDRMTVAARNALAERQRDIASAATQAEISNFSSLIQVTRPCLPVLPPPQQLLQMGYSADIREVLERLEGRMTYLRESAKQLLWCQVSPGGWDSRSS